MKLLLGLAALAALACGRGEQAAAPAPVPSTAGAQPAPAQAGGTLLIGNKGEDSLSFVDLATGAELGRAASGRMPHEIE